MVIHDRTESNLLPLIPGAFPLKQDCLFVVIIPCLIDKANHIFLIRIEIDLLPNFISTIFFKSPRLTIILLTGKLVLPLWSHINHFTKHFLNLLTISKTRRIEPPLINSMKRKLICNNNANV